MGTNINIKIGFALRHNQITELNILIPKISTIILLFFRIWHIHIMSISSSYNIVTRVISPVLPLPLSFPMFFMGHSLSGSFHLIPLCLLESLTTMSVSCFLVSAFPTLLSKYKRLSFPHSTWIEPQHQQNACPIQVMQNINHPITFPSLTLSHVDVSPWKHSDGQQYW